MAEMLRQPGSEDLGLPFGPNSGRRWYTLAKGRAGIRAPGSPFKGIFALLILFSHNNTNTTTVPILRQTRL